MGAKAEADLNVSGYYKAEGVAIAPVVLGGKEAKKYQEPPAANGVEVHRRNNVVWAAWTDSALTSEQIEECA